MDVQAYLNMSQDHYHHIREDEYEPFIGSGLYQSPQIEFPINESLDLSNKYCEPTEIGIWIYNVLNGIPMGRVVSIALF